MDFDPLAPETFDSPHGLYRELRERCPVARSEAWGGFWALLRHADVAAAAADWETFTTTRQNVVPPVAFTGRRPPLHLDPPEHTPYRRALAPLLSARAVERLRPIARSFSHDLLAGVVRAGGGDIVAELGAPMPIAVFAHWMNLSEPAVAELTDTGRRYNIAVQSNDEATTRTASARLYDLARGIVALRRAEPLPPEADAASALLAVRVNGAPLPEEMIVGTIRQVLVVGIIAPSVTIGAIAVHLARDRALQTQLRAAPALVPAAVEEFLRLYTPYRGFARTPRCAVTIGGRQIAADEAVALVYASANRDPVVFADPDRFVLHRPNLDQSLAFGRGPHACVGAALARLELAVALEALLAAAPGFALAGEPRPTRFPEIGALTAPIAFDRGAPA